MDFIDKYVEEFNRTDEEQKINAISNAEAAEWLKKEVPKFECPDKELEKIYYFRWWTYRKHLKKTDRGYAVSEFLLDVPWGSAYNIINAASGHHVSEGKWLKDAKVYMEDYIGLLLDKDRGVNCHGYSSWLLYALEEYFEVVGYEGLDEELLDKILWYHSVWEETHGLSNGMYWSIDLADAMEFSISGTDEKFNTRKGIRPTLNSYMYADCLVISHFARKLGKYEIEQKFAQKAQQIRKDINENLWKDDFYKAFHYNKDWKDAFLEKQIPMEELGYIPWMFNIPPLGREFVFDHLRDKEIFDAPVGITTADMREKRFLYEADHECLWNGYVWPFATSQTLKAMINVIGDYGGEKYKKDFYYHLKKYAVSHYDVKENGEKIPWIDEVLHPFRQEWTSVTYLKEHNFPKPMGPEKRGQYYNHSSFCDLIISGLCGVTVQNGKVKVKPIVPEEWEWFKLSDVYVGDKRYNIIYDKKTGCKVEIKNR